ncbi:MAG: PDZ domain-containing protein [Negativicutes bacterium]|nr:PDZ domain-containing protein [Negativicutes bacterium]
MKLLMFPWQDILLLIVRGTLAVFLEPMLWMIIALVAYQYWQLQRTQLKLFGVYGYTLRQQVSLAVLYGCLGGVVGSFLLTVVGITLNQLGLNYIWPVAIALMFINMRFLCFAYAGGLVAISSVLFGWPQVNVPQVLTLVAVLHITEAFLIFISGRYSAVPLILKKDDGRIVGAFNLQNFWPLPLVLMAVVPVAGEQMPAEVVKMPEWWPLLKLPMEPPPGHTWLYAMMPVVAALGYTDMAISSLPAKRRRRSALHLAGYSLVLLALALLSAKHAWLQIAAALLSPLGHEYLIQRDNRYETGGKPRFVPPPQGVMVLDTVPDSPARALGLKPGDILLSLDGIPLNSGWDLAHAISLVGIKFKLDIRRQDDLLQKEASFRGGERRLGVILVPDGYAEHYVELAGEGFGLIDWMRQKWKRR